MSKKKLLFVYHSMIIGGSTTSLLAVLNNLDPEKYDVELQLYRNEGPLLSMLPKHIRLLPPADICIGKRRRFTKAFRFILSGYAIKHLFCRVFKRSATGNSVMGDFQVNVLSRKNMAHYDFAIGFMEGWSDKYVAAKTSAETKYAWIHSTFSKISSSTKPLEWMLPMKKLIFVSDSCKDAFCEQIPEMADKAITIENITDGDIIKERSLMPEDDSYLARMRALDGLKIVTVCRLTVSVKGLDRIVNAAKALSDAGVDFLWYIIGDGEDADQLSLMISDAGISDRLIPIGRRMNPYPYLAAADLMCMPSRYEGKPMVVTEAMILGTPPVVTEYLSSHEQIVDGEEGVIVENNDTSVIPALLDLAKNKEKIADMRALLLSREYGNKDYIKTIETELF